jgi:hypothetical protein
VSLEKTIVRLEILPKNLSKNHHILTEASSSKKGLSWLGTEMELIEQKEKAKWADVC